MPEFFIFKNVWHFWRFIGPLFWSGSPLAGNSPYSTINLHLLIEYWRWCSKQLPEGLHFPIFIIGRVWKTRFSTSVFFVKFACPPKAENLHTSLLPRKNFFQTEENLTRLLIDLEGLLDDFVWLGKYFECFHFHCIYIYKFSKKYLWTATARAFALGNRFLSVCTRPFWMYIPPL